MCGIAGLVFPRTSAVDPERVRALSAAVRHRGPDDLGWAAVTPGGICHGREWPEERREAQAVLVHRRLSILDPSEAGHQPMQTPDGRYSLVYNGEVYNYVELREELARLGHRFRSGSDTEVLLAGWAEWGPRVLHRLVGMFAFAVVDRDRRAITLARDPFGIKPLYYRTLDGGMAFASEIRPLLGLSASPPRADPDGVYAYLRAGTTDQGGGTMFAGIRQLPSAHFLELPLDGPRSGRLERYWSPALAEPMDMSFDEAAAGLRDRFIESVRLHLRSDVPLGAALSGGIDSSAIVAAMRGLQGPGAEIHTFSYVADGSGLSEEAWSDLASGRAGSIQHKVRPEPADLLGDLAALIRSQEQPFGSTSIYAQRRVFRAAREAGIKVMIDGQGADELLAGYPMYAAARMASLLGRGRVGAAAGLRRAAARRAGSVGWAEALRLALPVGARLALGRALRPLRVPTWLNEGWFRARGAARLDLPQPDGPDVLRDMLLQTLLTTSLPALLRYEDRNSMTHSIESRVPFLTVDLAEFVLSLPEGYLLADDGTTKAVFRAAMRGIVPDPILDRRDKIGFATPELAWLRAHRDWVEAVLTSGTARRLPVLDARAALAEWRRIADGHAPFDFRVWRWVNLIEWAREFEVEFE